MSEGARKDCRTQGKYSEHSQYYEDKRSHKRQDKKQKESIATKEPQERKFHKRRSDGGKASNTSLISEGESPIRYEENSVHTFSQLKDLKKPVEIRTPGKHILSDTENGQSVVFYDPYFLEKEEASDLMKLLLNTTEWNEKKIVIHGAEVPQPRLVAWYGPFPYSYSGTTLEPAEMPGSVLEIRRKVEDYLNKNGINVTLNSVLLNLYRDNKDSVAWHSDDELSMGVCPTIASVSLGVTRKFEMRSKVSQPRDGDSPDDYFIYLHNGSLLIMDGCMQKDWQHRVPKEYHDKASRINLTFRTVYKFDDLPPSPSTYPQNKSCNGVPKKRSGSKTDFGVSYNDENFPPLNDGASSVHSDIRRESGASVGIKNRSSKGRSSRTSLKNSESNDILDAEQSCLKSDGFSQKPEDKICDSEGFWDSELSPHKSENPVVEPSQKEKCAILNNLNEDKKNIKVDMQNKNLCAYDSNFSNSNTNATANSRKYKTKGSCNGPTVNSAHKVNENVSDKNRMWMPNVEAKEFVPNFKSNNHVSESYDTFDLENLLNYNIDLMDSDLLKTYSVSLKNKVWEKMADLSHYAEELEVLCELTDGDQNEKNQRIISKRMSLIARRALIDTTSPDYQKPHAIYHRKFNRGNSNHFSGRKYQSNSRERHYRY